MLKKKKSANFAEKSAKIKIKAKKFSDFVCMDKSPQNLSAKSQENCKNCQNDNPQKYH